MLESELPELEEKELEENLESNADGVETTRASDASHLSCHTPNGPACASNRKGGAVRTRSVGDTSANRPECGLAKA